LKTHPQEASTTSLSYKKDYQHQHRKNYQISSTIKKDQQLYQ